MQSLSIGLSGLNAAQKALDVIGNNIANAASEGYHRQRIELVPAYSSQVDSVVLGGGVDVAGISRIIDTFLDQEILRQQSSLGHISQELTTLRNVEIAFGELSSGSSLSGAIDEFFSALEGLVAHPSEIVWQERTVTAAKALAAQFRTLGEFFSRLETQIALEAQSKIDRVNTLISEIAELNGNIERAEISGGQANNMRDQRDQRIAELSELIGLQVQNREHGVVDVSIADVPVVIGTSVIELQVGLMEGNYLGITAAGTYNYSANVQGGELGGLLSLRNDILSEFRDDLDTLASTIIQQVNTCHVQGLGSEGSFTELRGSVITSQDLTDLDPPVVDGSVYVRVTDKNTGDITRYTIDVDISADSLDTIAAKFDAVDGLSASVTSSRLHLQAEAGYEFDFLPAILSQPTASNLTAISPPTVTLSGIYNGSVNDTFTFTVIGTGSVGNGNLQLEVTDSGGGTIASLNIGAGYAAGDKLDIGNEIKVSLTTGDLNAGDTFEVDAFANTDTSGILAAIGINTFFSGHSASDIAVCSDIVSSPSRIATSLGAELTDNTNVQRLANLRDEALDDLGGMAIGEFYRQLATNVGQEVSIKQMRYDNVEVMLQNLNKKQGEMSGVNINDEAAQLLVFEQMFQAMAKYLTTIQTSMIAIMELTG